MLAIISVLNAPSVSDLLDSGNSRTSDDMNPEDFISHITDETIFINIIQE